jgi:hypothetical protein
MKRISLIPYGDISLLSLSSITPGTKFRLFSRIKEIAKDKIVFFDDQNEHSITHSNESYQDINRNDIVLAFGIKEESSIKIEKIIKMNLDWALLAKVESLERM